MWNGIKDIDSPWNQQETIIQSPPKRPHYNQPITFSNKDLKDVHTPHDDLLVVTVVVANFEVQKTLIDTSGLVDILLYETFLKMKLPQEQLIPAKSPLYWQKGNVRRFGHSFYPHRSLPKADLNGNWFFGGQSILYL